LKIKGIRDGRPPIATAPAKRPQAARRLLAFHADRLGSSRPTKGEIMSAQSPPLTEILTKLGDDWQIVRNRVKRHRTKRQVDDDDVKQFGIAVDEGQKCIGASDPSSKTVGDLHDALGKRACEEASQPTDGPEPILMLRRSLVPSALPGDGQKHLLGLTLDDAKVWMKQQADGWEQEDENRDEALRKHPFFGVLEWVAIQTDKTVDELREASLKRFDDCTEVVKELRRFDDKGQTRELWERLVKECPSVLIKAGLTPTGKTGEGEGVGGAGPTASQPATTLSASRKVPLKQLKPAMRKAYWAWQYAESENGRRMEDREAYDWLRENGIDQDKGDFGELTDYEPPESFETFKRYVVESRRVLNEGKYTRRAGRTGRSVVQRDAIE